MKEIPEKIDSKFRFVLLAASRAEQMMQGAVSKIDDPARKPSRLGLDEIRQDLVDWDYGPSEDVEEDASSEEEE